MAALRTLFKYRDLIVILGASADHVTPDLLRALLTNTDRAISTSTSHPRAASPLWIRDQARDLGFELETSPRVSEALDRAMRDAEKSDLICCTGSVFVAAEAREAWFARQGRKLPPSDHTAA
jgi:dihydrofolate synthase/folylpolyglutamate synthase